MATKPPTTKQRAAQTANMLGSDDLGSNLDDTGPAPDEFRLDTAPAAEQQFFTQADLDAAMERGRAEAMATQAEKSVVPLTAAQEAAVAHISSSGRAPVVPREKRIWIVLDDNDEIPPGGQFIGVNGVGYTLLPGVEAFVPEAICEILDQAVKSVPVQDPATKRIIAWKDRKRFPYTIVRNPKQTEAA